MKILSGTIVTLFFFVMILVSCAKSDPQKVQNPVPVPGPKPAPVEVAIVICDS